MGILHSAHLKGFPLHYDIILNGCVTPSSMYALWFTTLQFWTFRVFSPFLTGIKSIAWYIMQAFSSSWMVSLVEGHTDLHKRHKLMAFTIPFPTAFWKSNLLSVDLDKNSPLEQTSGSSACFHYTFPNTFPLCGS